MNKNKKIFLVLIITILIVSAFYEVAAVATINPDTYKPNTTTTDDTRDIFPKVGVILGAVRNISAVVAVITLMIIGLKYMFGSVEQKANYKATMMPYIIGCVLAVAGTTIVTFIYNAVYDL